MELPINLGCLFIFEGFEVISQKRKEIYIQFELLHTSFKVALVEFTSFKINLVELSVLN